MQRPEKTNRQTKNNKKNPKNIKQKINTNDN